MRDKELEVTLGPGRSARLKKCDKKEFMKYFNLFPKGNSSKTFMEMRYHVAYLPNEEDKPLEAQYIYEQWESYLTECSDENRENKFIKSMLSWIKAKDYNNKYNIQDIKDTWLDGLKRNKDEDYEL